MELIILFGYIYIYAYFNFFCSLSLSNVIFFLYSSSIMLSFIFSFYSITYQKIVPQLTFSNHKCSLRTKKALNCNNLYESNLSCNLWIQFHNCLHFPPKKEYYSQFANQHTLVSNSLIPTHC